MRKFNLYLLLSLINLLTLTTQAQKKAKKVSTLEITGSALLNDVRTNNYAISVYLDGTKVDSMYSKSKSAIKFYVAYDKLYTFLFQKQDCKDKIVIVNTKVPMGLKEMKDDTFDFEIEMSEALAKTTNETEDYPVAVLFINKDEEMLKASESYNKFTHQGSDVITTDVSNSLLPKNSKSDK